MAPEKGPTHTCKQSRFPHAPPLPCLAVCQGPTMSGKSSLLQRLATEVWVGSDGKSCFDRIYIFSPSVGSSFEDGIDETWTPVKRLVETQLIDVEILRCPEEPWVPRETQRPPPRFD